MIFDTHCHLNSPELYPRIEEIILDAKELGVDSFLVVGWDKQSSLLAIEIAEKYDFIYAAIGFHPTEIFSVSETEYEELMVLANHKKVIAIGEIGLDYHWNKDPKDKQKQKEWFIKQINFANKARKPICVHNRDAFEDCLNILKENKPIYGGVMHCYSGSEESLKDVLNLGLYISLGGPVTFKNAKTPKEVAQYVPLDKLLVETDCPYLSPHPLRGTINEPKNINLVVEEIARIRGCSKKHISDNTYNNACKLFGIKQ